MSLTLQNELRTWMSEINWDDVHSLRHKISRIEEALEVLYDRRKEIIKVMSDEGMKQREIGAYWGISNPRVSQIINAPISK